MTRESCRGSGRVTGTVTEEAKKDRTCVSGNAEGVGAANSELNSITVASYIYLNWTTSAACLSFGPSLEPDLEKPSSTLLPLCPHTHTHTGFSTNIVSYILSI